MLVSFDWLKEYLGEGTDLSAEKIEELLTFHSFEVEGIEEVEGDKVIDIDVLPNRSSDCLCHRGIAREIATLTGTPLQHDPFEKELTLQQTDKIEVDIADTHACPRFTASLITGVTIQDSPEWLKKRLKAIGQRPINNIVDATNYVMFAIGQPLHAYDADLFPQAGGTWKFGVRFAREGEEVSLLAEGTKEEERKIVCKGTELLIIDNASDTPIGLAGVKGGSFAGVHEGTKNVIIEAAHFDPIITRKTARGLGIVIDASKRFENEPSRELPLYAQEEITALITEIAGGAAEGVMDAYLEKKSPVSVAVDTSRVNALLGLSLTKEEMKDILERLGATVDETDNGFTVTEPFERTDLAIEEDITEEIGRIYGYDHVTSVVPETVLLTEINARHYYSEKIRTALVALGFSEVITSSFRKKDEVQLFNALATDKSYVRSSLVMNLEEVLDKNAGFADLFGAKDTRVFEIGTVFDKTDSGVSEHIALALGVRVKQSGYTKKDDEILAAAIGDITNALDTNLSFEKYDGVVELHLSEVLAKLPVPTEYDPIDVGEEIVYKPFSAYPHMSRDIALWVGAGTSAADVEKVLNEHVGDLRIRTTLFDEFSKDGKTSYAFRLVFQSNEKTLTDEEVNAEMEKVNKAVEEKGWEVR